MRTVISVAVMGLIRIDPAHHKVAGHKNNGQVRHRREIEFIERYRGFMKFVNQVIRRIIGDVNQYLSAKPIWYCISIFCNIFRGEDFGLDNGAAKIEPAV